MSDLIRGDGKCRYAYFPGCCLCENEPEITVKIYDSLRFQKQDTGIFIKHCGEADVLRAEWEKLGKPEMILCCPRCAEFFKAELPEIPVSSLYDKLVEYNISGGCNSVDYCLHKSVAASSNAEVISSLAEDMGVILHEHEDDSPYPYIVEDIAVRNELKKSGHDAAHILELIFGMGASNTHLIHEHDHDHDNLAGSTDEAGAATGAVTADDAEADAPEDCNGNCADCASCIGCELMKEPPAPLPDEDKRRANREELIQMLEMLYWAQ